MSKHTQLTQPTEEQLEAQYEKGHAAAWRTILAQALRGLERDTAEWSLARLLAEREAAIAALREVCANHGDNDWSSDLHLEDIIEKHLARHLS